MLGHFAACPANVACVRICSTPFSSGRGIVQCSPSLCTVRFSFSQHLVGSRLLRLVLVLPPHFLLFVDTTARTPASSSGPPLISFIFPFAARARSAPWSGLSPQHDPSLYLIHAIATSGVLRPTSVHRYKISLVLALLLHPHFPRIRSRAT